MPKQKVYGWEAEDIEIQKVIDKLLEADGSPLVANKIRHLVTVSKMVAEAIVETMENNPVA